MYIAIEEINKYFFLIKNNSIVLFIFILFKTIYKNTNFNIDKRKLNRIKIKVL